MTVACSVMMMHSVALLICWLPVVSPVFVAVTLCCFC